MIGPLSIATAVIPDGRSGEISMTDESVKEKLSKVIRDDDLRKYIL